MAPLANTMGFIDCNACKFFVRVNDSEDLTEVVALTKFGRDIEQSSKWMTALKILKDSSPVVG